MQDFPVKNTGLEASFLLALQNVEESANLCVALSGGRDSVVLLHAAVQLAPDRVRATHVQHGLHPDADHWAEHCQLLCERLQVPLRVQRVSVDPNHPQGLEAAARDVRYAALRSELEPAEVLLTAHHEQDQLETFMLQLFRGAGVAGLAAMPLVQVRDEVVHLRPMLHVSAELVEDYALQHRLEWIEDPSNADHQFDRNYLRHKILPLIAERWPSAARSVSRAARLNAVAADLQTELAQLDLADDAGLMWVSIDRLRSLSLARLANVVRYLLRVWQLPVPSEVQLHQALSNLLTPLEDRQPEGCWPGVRVRRYRDRLWFFRAAEDPVMSMANAPGEYSWLPGELLDMGPVRGVLESGTSNGGGIAGKWFAGPLQVKFRRGGETIRPASEAANRKLKKLLQENDIFPWMRCHIPLVYAEDRLLAVGDLWVDADASASAGEPGYRISWRNHAPIHMPSGL
jgi:tRNA(Ile)-lysidine synthase